MLITNPNKEAIIDISQLFASFRNIILLSVFVTCVTNHITHNMLMVDEICFNFYFTLLKTCFQIYAATKEVGFKNNIYEIVRLVFQQHKQNE